MRRLMLSVGMLIVPACGCSLSVPTSTRAPQGVVEFVGSGPVIGWGRGSGLSNGDTLTIVSLGYHATWSELEAVYSGQPTLELFVTGEYVFRDVAGRDVGSGRWIASE